MSSFAVLAFIWTVSSPAIVTINRQPPQTCWSAEVLSWVLGLGAPLLILWMICKCLEDFEYTTPPIPWRRLLGLREPAPKPQPWEVCVRCGYDLRASVGRCSECGRTIPPRPPPRPPKMQIVRGFVIVRRAGR